jgi:hypothetical protein
MRDKIPDGSSIEELAQFWDIHDVTDYLDQLKEVTGPIFERRLEGIGHPSEEEIDELVIAEVDDDSAWEEPIKVKRVPERPDSRK